jgi:hypothetical protein
MVVCGLVAFVIAHQRGDRARRREKSSELAIETGAAGAAE